MKANGVYILSLEGEEVEVTDPKEALSQAKMFVRWHEVAKREASTNKNVFYCEDAHKSWKHSLQELEKIQIKHPNIFL